MYGVVQSVCVRCSARPRTADGAGFNQRPGDQRLADRQDQPIQPDRPIRPSVARPTAFHGRFIVGRRTDRNTKETRRPPSTAESAVTAAGLVELGSRSARSSTRSTIAPGETRWRACCNRQASATGSVVGSVQSRTRSAEPSVSNANTWASASSSSIAVGKGGELEIGDAAAGNPIPGRSSQCTVRPARSSVTPT